MTGLPKDVEAWVASKREESQRERERLEEIRNATPWEAQFLDEHDRMWWEICNEAGD